MSGFRDERYHAALASKTRRAVLETVTAAPSPTDARAIATALTLHVTTVRFHLDQLQAAQLVRRESDGEKRRGRPRVLYVAVDDEGSGEAAENSDDARRDEDSREQLIGILADTLSHRDIDQGESAAIDAGHAWGRSIIGDVSATRDRSEVLWETLDRLGFAPVREGAAIDLRACPFRDAARQHPQVICSIHLGLVREVLGEARSQNLRLLPFIEPHRCRLVNQE